MNAASLDEEYSELTMENLPKLHDLIRPFFLRYVEACPSHNRVLIVSAGEQNYRF